jgi:hypothetical protein
MPGSLLDPANELLAPDFLLTEVGTVLRFIPCRRPCERLSRSDSRRASGQHPAGIGVDTKSRFLDARLAVHQHTDAAVGSGWSCFSWVTVRADGPRDLDEPDPVLCGARRTSSESRWLTRRASAGFQATSSGVWQARFLFRGSP